MMIHCLFKCKQKNIHCLFSNAVGNNFITRSKCPFAIHWQSPGTFTKALEKKMINSFHMHSVKAPEYIEAGMPLKMHLNLP